MYPDLRPVGTIEWRTWSSRLLIRTEMSGGYRDHGSCSGVHSRSVVQRVHLPTVLIKEEAEKTRGLLFYFHLLHNLLTVGTVVRLGQF